MTQELFYAAKLKVKRADQHIGELNQILEAFVNSDFCRFFAEFDTNIQNYSLKFEMATLPEMFPVIVGETLQNLRSALDLLMWELIELCGGTPTKETSFPISASRDNFVKACKKGEIQNIGNSLITLLQDVIKPYKGGGDDSLWGLNSLNNIDKHRLLITTASGGRVNRLTIFPNNIILQDCAFLFSKAGGVANIIGMSEPFEFYVDGQTVLVIVFSERESFDGQAVIPTLHSLSQLVAGIINDIERAYLART